MREGVVYNHWTGTVDWNGGMEWWNRKFGKNIMWLVLLHIYSIGILADEPSPLPATIIFVLHVDA